jgi:transposase
MTAMVNSMSNFKFVEKLTDFQLEELKLLMEGDADAQTRLRAQAILLSNKGRQIDDISAIVDCHRNTVSRWIDQWNERGVDGLLRNSGQGRKPALGEHEEKQVLAWLEEDPRNLARLLARIESELGKSISRGTLRRLLKRRGKVWKRMRASLAEKRDEEEFRLCRQELEEHVEASINGDIDLFFMDETGFGRVPYIPYAWQDKGATMALPCREGKRINIIGIYSFTEGTLKAKMTDKKVTSAAIVEFFDTFSQTLGKFTVVVIDNASIHVAKAVQAKLAEWEGRNLYLYFLPTYSPELNFIEIVWRNLKYQWLPIRAFESFKTLWDALVDILPKIGVEYNIKFA